MTMRFQQSSVVPHRQRERYSRRSWSSTWVPWMARRCAPVSRPASH